MRRLPMFPLGTVLLPHRLLPLHVFEDRYRALVQDVLAGDGEFGVVLIRRGHEVGGGDERCDAGTLARILRAEELADGRWLLLAAGTRPLMVRRWLEDAPYPHAEVEDRPDDAGAATRGAGQAAGALLPRLRRVLDLQAELGERDDPERVELSDDPATASWQLAATAPLTTFDAQRVLEAASVATRLRLLDELLRGLEEAYAFRAGRAP